MRNFDFRILGTDICASVPRTAATAIYPEEMVQPIPAGLRQRHLLRSRDRAKRLVRITPDLRERVQFRHLNFMAERYRLQELQDVVFCRNVIIYFDNEVRAAVLSRICQCIEPGGYLFMGHSETLAGFPLPLRQIAPTVHVRV